MPAPELSRRRFSQVAGGAVTAPLGLSDFGGSLTVPRPSTRWRFDTDAEVVVLPGLFQDTSFIGDTLFLDSDETVRAVDSTTGDQRWQFDVGDENWGFHVGANAVYVALGQRLHSLDADGSKRWEFETGDRRHDLYRAVEAGDTVYANSTSSAYAIDATSGTERWQFDENLRTTTVADDAVYGVTSELAAEVLYALDASDGTVRWRFEVDDDGPANLAGVLDGTCYLWRKGTLYGVDASAGTELWQFSTADDSWGFWGQLTEDTVYVWNKSERTLYALDARDGTTRWQFEVSSEPGYGVEVVDDAVVVETEAAVYALDATTGTRRWRCDRESETDSFLSDADEEAVYAQNDGTLRALAVADGSVRWQFAPSDGEVKYAKRAGDTVYAGTGGGTLYALEGPARTPIDAAIHAVRTNAGAFTVAALLGGGLVAEAYRRTGDADEAPGGESADPGVERLEPIDTDGPLDSYRARLPDGREVLLKRPSEEATASAERFLQAVEELAELDHENVSSVFDWGPDLSGLDPDTDPSPWVALSETTGESVVDGEIDVGDRVEALAVACEAVHAAHRNGIIHGRLSPDDVRFASSDCQPSDVRVGGWVEAAFAERGKPSAYAAPEQVDDREADPVLTDVYRLGAVGYRAVTGQPPEAGQQIETGQRAKAGQSSEMGQPPETSRPPEADQPTPPTGANPDLPPELDAVFADALAADPDERYRSALKLADALRWAVRQ